MAEFDRVNQHHAVFKSKAYSAAIHHFAEATLQSS